MQLLELQKKVDDGERELERQIELTKMAELQNEELRGRNEAMQSQVENSLSQSHESMEKIFAENRKLEH